MTTVILSFLTAYAVVFLSMPAVLKVAHSKRLFDEPSERSSHSRSIPRIGGVALFGGLLLAAILWAPPASFKDLQFVILALGLLFFFGIKDDTVGLTARTKLIVQSVAAIIVCALADIRISSLQGVLGIEQLPWLASLLFSAFVVVVIINAFNLVDGINGLAAGTASVVLLLAAVWFSLAGLPAFAVLAAAATGAALGFLPWNVSQARTFMGDTGAWSLGLVTAVLIIRFLECQTDPSYGMLVFRSAPAVALGLLSLPLIDTTRVFILRITRGRSPFAADRSHLHHLLIDAGFSHMQATAILVGTNILFIAVVTAFDPIGTHPLLVLIFFLAIALTQGLAYYSHRSKRAESSKLKAESEGELKAQGSKLKAKADQVIGSMVPERNTLDRLAG
jgi:UDP-GlcNAc:undecaprenyl-phosphate GlcNAc-1-phosphate transferase